MIDTSNPDGISVGSVHGQCACDLLAARTKADALAKRAEALEEMLYRLYVYDDNEAYHEGRNITERHAGRAK